MPMGEIYCSLPPFRWYRPGHYPKGSLIEWLYPLEFDVIFPKMKERWDGWRNREFCGRKRS
jgi:hypothetical protein